MVRMLSKKETITKQDHHVCQSSDHSHQMSGVAAYYPLSRRRSAGIPKWPSFV
ncbi:hypothetical protein CY34DRAFT_811446 [Suillus luteus UH-Slu-Lm8-n1]|uniref:Uncharacterized protein n=1 Tax=Suillus luteus UH-Slu-Lm8-n1 TaxID=930992 RepID=A0A0D0ADL6_9AGAM|nr:hypothetical protein CY34DRAFT_811446 [Suillus luteus UH-Slu-Lm8-n1]